VRQRQSRQPAPQRSRLEAVRACVRAVRIGAQNREGGSCGGGFPAGGAGGAGRRTVAWLASVAIASSRAAVPAAVAVSSAPLWRGGDESDRWRRKRRARGERGVGAGASIPADVELLGQRACPALLIVLFFPKTILSLCEEDPRRNTLEQGYKTGFGNMDSPSRRADCHRHRLLRSSHAPWTHTGLMTRLRLTSVYENSDKPRTKLAIR
jgi:hypothetical protein